MPCHGQLRRKARGQVRRTSSGSQFVLEWGFPHGTTPLKKLCIAATKPMLLREEALVPYDRGTRVALPESDEYSKQLPGR